MTVSETIGQEAAILCAAVLAGAGLFFLYDILRIFRRIIPHGAIWVGVEDFVFWLICTGVVFVMIYRENDGMVRGFALGGVVLGMLAYLLLLSRFVVGVNVRILKAVLGFVKRTGAFFLRPFWRIWKKTAGFLRKQLKKFWKAVKIGLSKR